MDPLYCTIFSGIFGSMISIALVHWLTTYRDKCSRLRTFKGYIRSVRAELMAIDLTSKDHRLVERHHATIDGVRRACCDASNDIPVEEFERAWIGYCGLTEPDIACRKGDEDNSISAADDPLVAFSTQYQKGRNKMTDFLDNMIELAAGSAGWRCWLFYWRRR